MCPRSYVQFLSILTVWKWTRRIGRTVNNFLLEKIRPCYETKGYSIKKSLFSLWYQNLSFFCYYIFIVKKEVINCLWTRVADPDLRFLFGFGSESCFQIWSDSNLDWKFGRIRSEHQCLKFLWNNFSCSTYWPKLQYSIYIFTLLTFMLKEIIR